MKPGDARTAVLVGRLLILAAVAPDRRDASACPARAQAHDQFRGIPEVVAPT